MLLCYNFSIIIRKEKNKMMKPAKHSLDIGLIASDIKASLHFYQNLLGLEFVGTMPLWFGTMHRLRFGESDFKLIEPKEVPPGAAIGLEKQLGFRYVTFVIENLSQLCDDLKKTILNLRSLKERSGPACALPWSKTRTEILWNLWNESKGYPRIFFMDSALSAPPRVIGSPYGV